MEDFCKFYIHHLPWVILANQQSAAGNAGFGGSISWADMAGGSHQGFAVVSTDVGTRGASEGMGAQWAENAPEKVADWGYRALHGSVVLAKQLIRSYYGQEIKYSYYTGCSTGGRQGMKEAQMFPDDFDGIIAGAPACTSPSS
jgi:feruloyl esterase